MSLRAIGKPLLKDYIPQKYAPRMLKHFYENSILSAICNTDYQGEFTNSGQSILIRKPATIDVRPYKDGDKVIYPEYGADSVEMKIDHGSIWSFKVSLLDKKQVDLKDFTTQWTQDASKQTQKYTETCCINQIITDDIAEGNRGTTAGIDSGIYNLGDPDAPVLITSKETSGDAQNATDYVSDMISVLSEQNAIDKEDAVSFICPKAYWNRLSKSNEFKYADKLGTSSTTVRMGQKAVGTVFGANVYETGYLKPFIMNGQKVFPVIACTKRAASFALQFTHTWNAELEGEVALGFRGITAFGCKLVEPRALALGYVRFN